MAKFKRKQTTVQAERMGGARQILTPHGRVVAQPGDWVITMDDGDQFPITHDRFVNLYEPIDDAALAMLGAAAFRGPGDMVDNPHLTDDFKAKLEASAELSKREEANDTLAKLANKAADGDQDDKPSPKPKGKGKGEGKG